MKIISNINDRKTDNIRWPIDCISKRIDEFDEVLILAKARGENRIVRFQSGFKDSFWWVGALEAFKTLLLSEGTAFHDI